MPDWILAAVDVGRRLPLGPIESVDQTRIIAAESDPSVLALAEGTKRYGKERLDKYLNRLICAVFIRSQALD